MPCSWWEALASCGLVNARKQNAFIEEDIGKSVKEGPAVYAAARG
jgi:hypothetical protein